jgi:phosphatidylserine/phosphatidylglycerophosphate/cardiolipin synthase-like enzyme
MSNRARWAGCLLAWGLALAALGAVGLATGAVAQSGGPNARWLAEAREEALANGVTVTSGGSQLAVRDRPVLSRLDRLELTRRGIFPWVQHRYNPPRYGVVIEAVLYDGVQLYDYDEAALLLNGADGPIDLAGWQLCKWGTSDWVCARLPARLLASGERIWLARSASGFANSFGHQPDHVLSSWPAFHNSGDEIVLRDADGRIQDTLVYELGDVTVVGWAGSAVWPYGGAGFASEGQLIYRYAAEWSGRPPDDTDRVADWAQYPADPVHGRRIRYAGWDLERFYQPAVAESGWLTVGIAPDNAYQVVVDAIQSADERLELELYTLEHVGLVNELVAQAQRGVSVTVLLEGGPAGGLPTQELWACQQLHATGRGLCAFMVNSDTLRIDDRYRFLHAKMIIIDRERVLVGSQNLNASDLPGDDKANGTGGSRGVVLVTDAPAIVARAVELFEADCDPASHADIRLWGPDSPFGLGPPPPGFLPEVGGDPTTYTVQFPVPLVVAADTFELISAPESALRTSDALLGLVGRAGSGHVVLFEQLYEYADWGDPVSAPNLRLQAAIDAARRGAQVRILLNGGMFNVPGFPLTDNLEAVAAVNALAQAEGLDLAARVCDPTHYGIHNKMVLVDLGTAGKYVHVGSINGSETSSKANREVALQVRSVAAFDVLRAMFEFDWASQREWHVVVSEVLYRPTDQTTGNREWIEVYNPTPAHIDLAGWYLGDMTADVTGLPDQWSDGMYRFPAGALLPAGGVIVVAQQAADLVGFLPDFELPTDPYRDVATVPNMVRVDPGTGDGLKLADTGDEVVLRDAGGALVDAVVYGAGVLAGVVAHPGGVNAGHSLERRPPEWDSDDCAQDFFDRYPPTPGLLSY